MKRLVWSSGIVLCALCFAACPERKPPAEPRTVQIEEQQIKVMTDPERVRQEAQNAIDQGVKARHLKIGE